MKDRKVEILLLATLTVCSAFYATVTMLYPQVFLVGGYMRKDEVVVREYTVSWGSFSIGRRLKFTLENTSMVKVMS